jgi:fucose 4-O-acetylase-like acetyltransferase
VVEWSLAYVAFGYAALHGVVMLRETFEWSAGVPRFTTFALVLGFPIAATLAWFHGHRAQQRVSRSELSILVALLLVAGSVLWWISREGHERATGIVSLTPAPASAQPVSPAFSPPAHSMPCCHSST